MNESHNNSPATAEPSWQRLPVDVKHTHRVAEFKSGTPLTCCRFGRDERFGYAGAMDFNLHRRDLQSGTESTLTGNRSWVRCIDASPVDGTIAAADWAGQVCLFPADAADGSAPLKSFTAHEGAARWVRFSPDGTALATCGNDLQVKLWNPATGEELLRLEGHQRHPYAVAFDPVQPLLVSQDLMGHLKVWSLPDGRLVHDWQLPAMTGYDTKFAADMGGARDLTFSADGSLIASAGVTNVKNAFAGIQDPLVQLTSTADGPQETLYKADSNFQGICWGVRFHPAGFLAGCGANRTGKGALWFWQQGKSAAFHTVDLPSAARGFDMTANGRRLLIAEASGTLSVWQLTAEPGKKSAAAGKK